MATFELRGLDRLTKNLQALERKAAMAGAVALNEVAETTMTDAKERTPVDTGRLRDTGRVASHATADKLEARLAYGTDYALFVHERTHVAHKVGEAKFLERAVMKAAATLAQDVARKIAAILGM